MNIVRYTREEGRDYFVNVQQAVDTYIGYCVSPLSSMDFESAHIASNGEPMSVPPNYGKRIQMERLFDRVEQRMDGAHWMMWVAKRINHSTHSQIAKAYNARIRADKSNAVTPAMVGRYTALVDSDIIYELKRCGMWIDDAMARKAYDKA